MKRSVNIIVIEPRTLLREGLVSLLHDSGFRVISAVATPDRVPQVAFERACLLIIGASNEPAETLEFLKKNECLKKNPSGTRNVKIVTITEVIGNVSHSDILKCLSHEADCCIFNVRSRDVLLRSLDLATMGQRIIVLGQDSGVFGAAELERKTDSVPEDEVRVNGDGAAHLSARELEILRFVVAGDSNKEIARTCHLAESTVKIHLKTILRKIRVRNRTQAAIWAIHNANGGELPMRIETVPLDGELPEDDLQPVIRPPSHRHPILRDS